MVENQQHKKICLSGDGDCSVVFCSACNLLDVNLDASTIRISPKNLYALSTILHNTKLKLAQVQNTTSVNEKMHLVNLNRVH